MSKERSIEFIKPRVESDPVKSKEELEPWLEEMYQRFINRPNALEIQKNTFSEELETLRPLIDTHQVNCILGDDKSGRIPALVMSKSINNIYSSRGEKTIPTLFIDPHMYKWVNEFGKLHVHKTPDNEEQINKISEEIDEKISKLFKHANLGDGTIVLVSDFVDTKSTFSAFKEIAEKNNLKLIMVSDDTWWSDAGLRGGADTIGSFHGLVSNDDYEKLTPNIHAYPLWKKISEEKDSREKIKLILANIKELKMGGIDWASILVAFKKEVDPSISVKVIEGSVFTKGHGDKSIANFLSEQLSSGQVENLIDYIKKKYFQNIREKIPSFSEKLAEEYLEK